MRFIDVSEIVNDDYTVLAHTGGAEDETLEEHVHRCQYYFSCIFEDKKLNQVIQRFIKELDFQSPDKSGDFLTKMSVNIVTFHDFGKLNPKFQTIRMKNKPSILKNLKGLYGNQHSKVSSVIYMDYFMALLDQSQLPKIDKCKLQSLIKDCAYLISRHHSNLNSGHLPEQDFAVIIEKLKNNPVPGYTGLRYFNNHDIRRFLYEDDEQWVSQTSLMKYFYARLMYSLLVASDYYATTEYHLGKKMDINKPMSVDQFKSAYEQSDLFEKIKQYEKTYYAEDKSHIKDITSINDLRSEIFIDANRELAKHMNEDIFFLEAPTGSGKSNTALGLTFQLLQNRQKVFYIYPFNTLVEQNRKILQQSFSDPMLTDEIVVVNSTVPIKLRESIGNNQSYDYNPTIQFSTETGRNTVIQYSASYLDRQFLNYPFILSTHVSFFKLLFGQRQEDVFGFYQLASSVVVLDEIQSYNNLIWAEMIESLKACAKLMDMKCIIMSATLPNLAKLAENQDGIVDLMKNREAYYQHPLFKERVKLNYELLNQNVALDTLLEHVILHQNIPRKILIEFISKRSAEGFYRKLKESDQIKFPVSCITGYDNIYQREKVLHPIKEGKISQMILVATQVIEAGVDIDMDIGYKDISILDSEEQFLGRINRSYKNKERQGIAYFFNMDSVKKIYRNDFRTNDDFVLTNKRCQKILENKNFADHYDSLMELIKKNRNDRMDQYGMESFYEDISSLNFDAIEQRMKLIEDNYWTVDVFFNRTITIDDRIINGEDVWNKYKALLNDNEMDYSQKQIRLSEIRSKMVYFIYSVPKNLISQFNDSIGDLVFIEDGEKYFIDGRLNLSLVEEDCLIL